MLPVAMAIQHAWRAFVTASCCVHAAEAIFLKTLLMKMGESCLMTKTVICRRIIKKKYFLGKVQKEPEKNGKKEIDRVVRA